MKRRRGCNLFERGSDSATEAVGERKRFLFVPPDRFVEIGNGGGIVPKRVSHGFHPLAARTPRWSTARTDCASTPLPGVRLRLESIQALEWARSMQQCRPTSLRLDAACRRSVIDENAQTPRAWLIPQRDMFAKAPLNSSVIEANCQFSINGDGYFFSARRRSNSASLIIGTPSCWALASLVPASAPAMR